MDLKEVRASLRRHWTIALVVLVIIPIVMAGYLASRNVVRPPARYTTSADVLIPTRDEVDGAPEGVPPVLLQGQIELAQSPEVKAFTLKEASVDPKDSATLILSSSLNKDRSVMTLTVAAGEPEIASTVLDAYITAYEEGRRQSVLEAALDLQEIERRVIGVLARKIKTVEFGLATEGSALPERVPDGDPVIEPSGSSTDYVLQLYERNALLNEIQRRQVSYSLQATRVEIPAAFTTVVQRRSTARTTPPPPSPLISLLAILAGGVALALVIPVLMDRLDPTITEARSAPGALRSGLLGTIPFMPRRLHHQLAPPGSTWERAFRSLAATSLSTDRLPKAIMVTGPTGSTQDPVAANFAAALAGLGVTVALIGTVPRQDWFVTDAEFEDDDASEAAVRPALGSGPGTGRTTVATATFPELLAEAEAGQLVGDISARLATRDIPNLFVIPPGATSTDLSLDGLPPLLEALSVSGIDICVLAGPALLEDPNATIMAWSTRHVLWALEIGQVDRNDAALAADRLELAGVTPFGIALVNRHALRA